MTSMTAKLSHVSGRNARSWTFQSRINGDLPSSFGFMIDGTLLFRSIKNGFR